MKIKNAVGNKKVCDVGKSHTGVGAWSQETVRQLFSRNVVMEREAGRKPFETFFYFYIGGGE